MSIYSHSRLSTYEQCPLKYKLSYIDGIKREEEKVIEAFLGSRVHETLEKCYNDLRYTKLNTLKELIAYYDKIWDTNWNDAIFISRKELSSKDYRQMGKKFIETYYQRYAPFDRDITIARKYPSISR
jgi:putative RecB family exonuclease